MADREVYVESAGVKLPGDEALYMILDTVHDQWLDYELPKNP